MTEQGTFDASVIMPVRNGAEWIRGQLDALAAQDFTGTWEIVIADNGSTDSTNDIVREFARHTDVPVRIADATARAGICHARNSGALAARGKLLVFCDCDDLASPGWLGAAVAASADGQVIAGLNRELQQPVQDPEAPKINPGGLIRGWQAFLFIGCNFAVDRDAYFAVGGFDESLPPYGCDDSEFALRANEAGLTFVGDEDMLLWFRRTTGLRRVLRKVYLSGKAETIMWHRHPQRFAERIGWKAAAKALLYTPRALRGGGLPGARAKARYVVTRWAHVVAELELLRGRYERDPIHVSADHPVPHVEEVPGR
ncbi:glycosyltransferase family 2 protein [Propionibacteriaceae bacterium Y1923]|uniref:glycosyltransferase family 2 protein n=1 Tax=Aestuariimicrobium sp. Y1814 TaxID=3418742 RepID=UPI003C1B071C